MDYHKEIRNTYLGGFSILIVEGIIWIIAGILWRNVSYNSAIFLIVIGGMFFFPLGELVQRLLRRPKISEKNPLQVLFTQISLVIPFTLPVVFMVILNNTNLFFPAMAIIVGAHFLPFVYAYKLFTFWILAPLLVVGGCLFGFLFVDHVAYCAYYIGILLVLFAFLNRSLILAEIKINAE